MQFQRQNFLRGRRERAVREMPVGGALPLLPERNPGPEGCPGKYFYVKTTTKATQLFLFVVSSVPACCLREGIYLLIY
jgi:hypothetical protein